MKWQIEFKDECLKELGDCLNKGPLIDDSKDQEIRFLNEELVATMDGLRIIIFANEHPSPHFHVQYNNESNSFRIDDCSPLNPKGLIRYLPNIKKWWRRNKNTLIKVWNNNRPADCPVGEYVE